MIEMTRRPPALSDLRRQAEMIRRAQVGKALKKLGPLTAEQRQTVEDITTAIVAGLLAPRVEPQGRRVPARPARWRRETPGRIRAPARRSHGP